MGWNSHSWIPAASLFLALGFLAIPHGEARAAWEIQNFEVFAGAPYQRADGVVEVVGYDWAEAEDWFPDFDRFEVEQAFEQAAAWYSAKGFPDPTLEPVVDTPHGPAYRVYVCSEAWWGSLQASQLVQEFSSLFSGPEAHLTHWSSCGRSDDGGSSVWAAYSGRCAAEKVGARPVFFINADGPAFRNGQLTAEGYQTVAHELFHAIQASTVMGKSPNPCEVGKWIGEGQADAIAMDLLDEIWPSVSQPGNDSWLSKKYGVRPYYHNIATDPSGYPVSSFWRFLADLNGGYDFMLSSKDGNPGVMDFEVHEAGSWQSETSWLDAGLYSKFNMRLNELLGLFLNDYSMRIPPQSWTSGDGQVDWPRYVKGVLGDCEEIVLSGRKTSQVFSRNIAPVAGDCAWLTVNLPQATTQVSLQSESSDVKVFSDVWVGLAEGDAILTDAMVAGTSPTDPSKSIGIWHNLTVRTGAPTLLTFTNAADDPDKTKRRVVIFEISLGGSDNNLRGGAPAGPGQAAEPAQKPTYKKHTKTLPKKQAATTRMITEQKRLDKEALSPYTGQSTSVSMRPNQPACTDPYKYQACGPSIAIGMDLMPGTYLNLGQSSGTGGTASQVFSSFMGQALSNPFDSQQVMTELDQKIKNIDAANVSISAPYFDYGFTGSINNAMISTVVGGQHMRSIGPPDASQNTPLIGTVSIEEYTPFVLRGRFSAPLAYFEPSPGEGQPPIYKRGPTLTGTFTTVAPWLADGRVRHIQLQNQTEMADDIGKALGVPASTMRALREDGSIPGGSNSPGGPSGGNSSGGTLGGDCDCDCAFKGKVDDLCEFFCEDQFAACPD